MRNLRELTGPELNRLIDCVSVLTAMRSALPAELLAKLDTYWADLLAEQEDRTVRGRADGDSCGGRLHG
ncbi:MAG TPA: hypothetical protein VGI74_19990 [Streptosporangiaceae bacterium]